MADLCGCDDDLETLRVRLQATKGVAGTASPGDELFSSRPNDGVTYSISSMFPGVRLEGDNVISTAMPWIGVRNRRFDSREPRRPH